MLKLTLPFFNNKSVKKISFCDQNPFQMMTRLVKRVQINVKIKHIIRQFKLNLTSKSHLISNTQFRPKVCLKLMSESMFQTKFD